MSKEKIVEKTKNKQDINYQGQVKIKVANGKKILSSKTYHNNGRNLLFRYICNCLAGLYDGDSRPSLIKLFTIAPGESTSEFKSEDFSSDYSASPYIPTFISPVTAIVDSSETNLGYTVTYHFRIPYQRLSNSKIYKAAIYSNGADDPENMMAWFKFVDSAGTSFEPIEVDTENTNYSIIIEWTMKVENKD